LGVHYALCVRKDARCALVAKSGRRDALDRDEILTKIQEITADRLGVDESDVTPDASFREDLEADSLDLVELIMELEEQFGMEIPDEEAEKITTVEEAVDYVQEHQAA
jgi:acyl carrier protein